MNAQRKKQPGDSILGEGDATGFCGTEWVSNAIRCSLMGGGSLKQWLPPHGLIFISSIFKGPYYYTQL